MYDVVICLIFFLDVIVWFCCQIYVVQIGGVIVGGGKLVVVQLMINIDMFDVVFSVKQVVELWCVGLEMVWLIVNIVEVVVVILCIVDKLVMMGIDVLLIGDFYYNGYQLFIVELVCVEVLVKYCINLGNVGFGKKKDLQFVQLIEFVICYNKLVCIGVNWGLLDQVLVVRLMDENSLCEQFWDVGCVLCEVLICLVLDLVEQVVEFGLLCDCIVLLVKVSGVQELIVVYCDLVQCLDFVLYLGLIEVGIGSKGIVVLLVVLSVLLQEGIGDIICILLILELGQLCMQEVIVVQELLQIIGQCVFMLLVMVCLGCGCIIFEFFQELVKVVQNYVCEKMLLWKIYYLGVENMILVVMGCIVNGLGELCYVNIGIFLLGIGEMLVVLVFVDGEKKVILCGDNIVQEFVVLIDDYVEYKYV